MMYFNVWSDTNYFLKGFLLFLIIFIVIFIAVKIFMQFYKKIEKTRRKRLKTQRLLHIMENAKIDEKEKFNKIVEELEINSSYELWERLNVWGKYILELISNKEFGILNRIIYNEILKKNEK